MKKYILSTLLLLLPLISFSQTISKQNELFTNFQEVRNKIVFVREIDVEQEAIYAYALLESWGKEHYGKTPILSRIKYSKKEKEISTTSKIELILPNDEKNINESIIMKYKLTAYIKAGKCIVEISDIEYSPSKDSSYSIGKSITAEMFLPKDDIATNTVNESLQIRTKKATIYFLNKLSKSLDQLYSHPGNDAIQDKF